MQARASLDTSAAAAARAFDGDASRPPPRPEAWLGRRHVDAGEAEANAPTASTQVAVAPSTLSAPAVSVPTASAAGTGWAGTPSGTATSTSSSTKPRTTSTSVTVGTSTSIVATRAPVVGAGTASTSSPLGPPGSWKMAFDDEFNGNALDRSRWTDLDGWQMNNVTTRASNVAVIGGNLVLTLSSTNDGAEIDSSPADGAGPKGFLLQVGDYAEARIDFPGDGQRVYNWPAWWASGPGWPAAGEHDIAEGLSGDLTVSYHSASGAHNQGVIPGSWGSGYHVYGVHRLADHADVYWNGVLVKSYPTDDNGQGESLLVNVGRSSSPVTGPASAVKVDWVRAYRPSA